MMKINGEKARKLISKGAVLIDIRSPIDFNAGSLPGAVNIVLRNVSMLASKYKKTQPLIIFSLTNTDPDIEHFISYATTMGFTQVHSLGSIRNWM